MAVGVASSGKEVPHGYSLAVRKTVLRLEKAWISRFWRQKRWSRTDAGFPFHPASPRELSIKKNSTRFGQNNIQKRLLLPRLRAIFPHQYYEALPSMMGGEGRKCKLPPPLVRTLTIHSSLSSEVCAKARGRKKGIEIRNRNKGNWANFLGSRSKSSRGTEKRAGE